MLECVVSDGQSHVKVIELISFIYFQLVTDVLLRRAYSHPSAWAQWLCLAALEILHGKDAPRLDAEVLHMLHDSEKEDCLCTKLEQISPSKKVSPNIESIGKGFKSPKFVSPTKESAIKGSGKSRDDPKRERHANFNDKVKDGNLPGGTKPKHTSASRTRSFDDCTQKLPMLNKGVQVENITLTSDYSVQVTPKLMHRTCNKWTQIRKSATKPEETQTEEWFWKTEEMPGDTKDASSQTDMQERPKGLTARTSNSATQTILTHQKHVSTQTKHKNQMANPGWYLIPLSGLPKKGGVKHHKKHDVTESSLERSKKFPETDSSESTFNSAENLSNNIKKTAGLPALAADVVKVKKHKSKKEKKTYVDMFHGRPLMQAKSTMDAAVIPLECPDGIARLMVQDPREDNI